MSVSEEHRPGFGLLRAWRTEIDRAPLGEQLEPAALYQRWLCRPGLPMLPTVANSITEAAAPAWMPDDLWPPQHWAA